jgi:hypothetical protein
MHSRCSDFEQPDMKNHLIAASVRISLEPVLLVTSYEDDIMPSSLRSRHILRSRDIISCMGLLSQAQERISIGFVSTQKKK